MHALIRRPRSLALIISIASLCALCSACASSPMGDQDEAAPAGARDSLTYERGAPAPQPALEQPTPAIAGAAVPRRKASSINCKINSRKEKGTGRQS